MWKTLFSFGHVGSAASVSFHLVVFRSVEKTQDNTLVWWGIKVWGKNPLQGKTWRENDRWETRKILSGFFFPFQNETRHSILFLCFSALILSRDCSRQILSWHAVLVLIQSKKNVIMNCNSSAINYSSMVMLLIFCLSTVCVRASAWGEGTGVTYPVIIFCFCSKVFWENINCV